MKVTHVPRDARNPHPENPSAPAHRRLCAGRRWLLGLLGLAGFTASLWSQAPVITGFKLEPGRRLSLDWRGATNRIVIETTASLSRPDWQPLPGVEWPIQGDHWSGTVPVARAQDFVRLVSLAEGGAPLPSRTLSLDVIGIHDHQSAAYNPDCISCHGTRTNEVALDGVTIMAHGTMLPFYPGPGNQRCLDCHTPGPDFLTHSRAGLREQVDMTYCFTCHGSKPLLGARAFYAR